MTCPISNPQHLILKPSSTRPISAPTGARTAKRSLALILDEDEEEVGQTRRQRVKRTAALQVPVSSDAFTPSTNDIFTPSVASTSRYAHYSLLRSRPHLITLSRSPASASASLDQQLLETPILKRFRLKIHAQYSLLICTLCDSGLLLSHLHTHVTADANKIPKLSLSTPDSRFDTISHQMKPGLTRAKLETAVKEEVQRMLGITDIWDWKAMGSRDTKEWREFAWPSEGQPLPIKGIREYVGLICTMCDEPHPYCCQTPGSAAHHIKVAHKGVTQDPDKPNTRESVVQSKSLTGGYMCYFPVPGVLPSGRTAAITTQKAVIQDIPSNMDDDGDAVWDAMLNKQQTVLLPNATVTTKPGVLNEKTLPLFYRDYGLHDFLARYSPEECLSLSAITHSKGASKPRQLKRLSAVVADTFIQDCDMVLKMAPAIRRLIVQSDP